jgi:hypothetical protein
MDPIQPLDQFLNLSSVLTGFDRVELEAAGTGAEYLAVLSQMAGENICFEMWAIMREIGVRFTGKTAVEKEVKKQILGSAKYAPLARNIIYLWYNAIWYQLPREWTEVWGANAADTDFVISATAYPEALIWKAMGAHPPAAKPQGFGAWALPPEGSGKGGKS